jgi:hypothetical protein
MFINKKEVHMPYRQCTLQRTKELGDSLSTTVSYIPSKLSVVGKFVDIKEPDGSWRAWQVITAGEEISDELAKKVQEKYHDGWGSLDMPRRRGQHK